MSNLAADFAQFIADRKRLLRWDDMSNNEKLAIEIAYTRGWADGRHRLLSDRVAELSNGRCGAGFARSHIAGSDGRAPSPAAGESPASDLLIGNPEVRHGHG